MLKPAYIEAYWPLAHAACEGTGISPLLALAESATESEWGESYLSKEANNLFGIKSTESWESAGGKFVWKNTHEFTADISKAETPLVTLKGKDGKTYYRYTIKAKFRKYDSAEDCFANWAHFITQPGYVAAGILDAKTPEEQAAVLQKKGYATAPNYSAVITNIMHGLVKAGAV